jgi:hypothetical protein
MTATAGKHTNARLTMIYGDAFPECVTNRLPNLADCDQHGYVVVVVADANGDPFCALMDHGNVKAGCVWFVLRMPDVRTHSDELWYRHVRPTRHDADQFGHILRFSRGRFYFDRWQDWAHGMWWIPCREFARYAQAQSKGLMSYTEADHD